LLGVDFDSKIQIANKETRLRKNINKKKKPTEKQIKQQNSDFRKFYRVNLSGEGTYGRRFCSVVVRGDCVFLLGGKKIKFCC
jgi:hypothetical protein